MKDVNYESEKISYDSILTINKDNNFEDSFNTADIKILEIHSNTD